MIKIGIVTLNGKHNYGNRLQNFALQAALRREGAEVVTLTQPRRLGFRYIAKAVLKPVLRYTPLYSNRLNYVMKKKKSKGFHAFDSSHIEEQRIDRVDLDSFDIFIAGSDQVWNPKFAGNDFQFLAFAPKNKRASYAASFGVSEVPKEQQEFYRKNLEGMRSISVREEAGVEIVRSLTGREAELVPDPTILLDKEDWGRLTEKYNYLKNERYLVVYALHSLDVSAKSQIESYASENDLEIYQIMGDFYHPEHKTPDPAEFVARIKYAQAVFTDSFHACVFSIIMHTPFKVFDRKDMKMSSRIETLLKTYQMQSATSDRQIDAKSYDFEKSDKIAAQERARGMSYLTKLISAEKAT